MKHGKRYKNKTSINDNVNNNNRFKISLKTIKLNNSKLRILSILFILICIFSINHTISYFTDFVTHTNEFDVDAYYTVTFNPNTGTGTMQPQEISYNVPTNLTANSYTKNGYYFNNWNTNPNGNDEIFSDEQSVTNLDDIALYAQWNLVIYNLTYILNGGTVSPSNPDTYTIETNNFTLNNPTRTGYSFNGWSGTGLSGNSNTSVTISQGSTGDRTYTANYTANRYYIRFNPNGGSSATMPDQTMTYDTASNLLSNKFLKSGYTFKEWNTAADGSGDSYQDKESVINLTSVNGATVDLYAQWEQLPTKYAVQIYGINQDVDANGNALGLTFGPATGANYNNRYVTHEYEETSEGSGEYYVKILTHTVSANGNETISETILTDSSNNNVIRTSTEKEKYDINIHEMTWAEIKAVSDKTVFTDCMLCGDTKSVNLFLNSTISNGAYYTQYGDGAGILYHTIRNTTNAYYRRWNYSSLNARNAGGYSSSRIRATLIGKNEKTNTTYAGNVNLTENTCLYSCIEYDLKDVITPKKIRYVTGSSKTNYTLNDDIADSIWLFSEREICGTADSCGNTTEGLGTNGVGYNKFRNTKSKYYMSSYTTSNTTNRIAWDENGSASLWWLRSPHLSSDSIARYLYSTGSININYQVSADLGISFGFCIQ